jgi:hypothetical protein
MFHGKKILERHAPNAWREKERLIFLRWRMRVAHGEGIKLPEAPTLGVEDARSG